MLLDHQVINSSYQATMVTNFKCSQNFMYITCAKFLQQRPAQCGTVGWSIIQYTKTWKLQIRSRHIIRLRVRCFSQINKKTLKKSQKISRKLVRKKIIPSQTTLIDFKFLPEIVFQNSLSQIFNYGFIIPYKNITKVNRSQKSHCLALWLFTTMRCKLYVISLKFPTSTSDF